MDPAGNGQLGRTLWSYALEGRFIDCFVHVGKRTWSLHTCVLGASSKFFASAFGGAFEESCTHQITLEDTYPDEMEAFFYVIYNGDFPEGFEWRDPTRPSHDPSFQMTRYARMYSLGDQYMVEDLKVSASAKFQAALDNYTSITEINAGAASGLIPLIYESTPSEDKILRKKICYYLTCRLNKKARKALFSNAGFLRNIDQVEGFAKDYMYMLGTTYGADVDNPKEVNADGTIILSD